MANVCLYTDEDIYGAIAPALREAGVDANSTPETGRLGTSDQSQLEWAAAQGRTLITFNVAHFVALHTDWVAQGRSHAGIVVSSQRTIGDLLRRLIHLAETMDVDQMRNRLEFLSDW